MTVPFLLIADLLAKLPSEPATPQIESESASELYKADDVAIDGTTNQISSRDISPPELSSLLPGSTDSWSNHWLLNDSPPELPPLAGIENICHYHLHPLHQRCLLSRRPIFGIHHLR